MPRIVVEMRSRVLKLKQVKATSQKYNWRVGGERIFQEHIFTKFIIDLYIFAHKF